MWGWSRADFPLVSQQHGTSHRIEQYHIIRIREMCWKAISCSNKWPTAQQKPEESHLCERRLCHEKSLILNPLTCHPHSKGLRGRESIFGMGAREQGNGRLQEGSMRDTKEKGGTGVTPVKRGACEGVGWGSHPCSWLVPCEALCFLSLPSEGLCFTCKQWQWPQLAWPSAASKLAWPRKEEGAVVRIGRGIGLREEGGFKMPVLSGHWCHACAHRGRAEDGPRHPFFFFPSPQSLFPRWMNLWKTAAHCLP